MLYIIDDYISTFVDVFRHEREHYVAVEHEVETLCKTFLYEKGVKFCWESRVKQPDSLQTKLLGRNHRYPDQHANCADIKDLVAGRIILPRWSNFKVVEEMIKEHFELQATTQHPKAPWGNATTLRQRFRGYDGFHFYFKRKIPVAGAFNPTIEIQVMSPFMWTFQDLHHDVEYKELCGKPSQEESRALEYLKGIANLGELAIQNFETAFSARHQPSSKSMDDVLESEVPKKTPIVQDLESQEDMKSLKALVIEQARGMDSLLQMLRQQSDGSNEIISWISSTNVDVEHSRIRDKLGKHYHHSGQWFKRHYYSSWIASTDKPTMWLAGSVGTGKSSLM
jgi:ppGpp synthetase/RelA/SpoT-type nucleotidyltranferase